MFDFTKMEKDIARIADSLEKLVELMSEKKAEKGKATDGHQ